MSATAANKGESTRLASPGSLPSQSDRKFNIILYGVDECPSGSSRAIRLESDLSNAVSVLSSVEPSIQSQIYKGLL